MVSDPRCPHCTGKVSATATWCMHCGEDFQDPVDADTGRPVEGRGDRGLSGGSDALDGSEYGSTAVGIVLSIAALVTLPWASPSGVTLFYLLAVVGIGVYASRQPTASDALRDGGAALAIAPILLWLVSAVTGGLADLSGTSLLTPFIYAFVATAITRRLADEASLRRDG